MHLQLAEVAQHESSMPCQPCTGPTRWVLYSILLCTMLHQSAARVMLAFLLALDCTQQGRHRAASSAAGTAAFAYQCLT